MTKARVLCSGAVLLFVCPFIFCLSHETRAAAGDSAWQQRCMATWTMHVPDVSSPMKNFPCETYASTRESATLVCVVVCGLSKK